MWSKLPRFLVIGFLVVGLASVAFFVWKVRPGENRQLVPLTDEASPAGELLLERAAAQLQRMPLLQASLKQRGDVLGKPFEGTGAYWQFADDSQMLLKLNLNIQVGKQRFSIAQVNDGSNFWMREAWTSKDQEESSTLQRVDLQKLRGVAVKPTGPAGSSAWMVDGGLPKLLKSLSENFDFAEPQTADIAGAPVYVLQGTWNREALAKLLPEKADQINNSKPLSLADLPNQLPDRVRIVLSRDAATDLFPYIVEYYRGEQSLPSQPKATRPKTLMQMVIRPVAKPKLLTTQDFRVRVDDQEVTDVTEEYLAKLQAKVY